MTNKEFRERYPKGTRIKYTGSHHSDRGKKGVIVGYKGQDVVEIVVPKSDIALALYQDSGHTWTTYISSIEILPQAGQLLFNFMYSME